MKNIKVKAIIKAIEAMEKTLLIEEKIGWCNSFTSSNLIEFETETTTSKSFFSNQSYFKIENVFPEPRQNVNYLMGTIYSHNKPFGQSTFVAIADVLTRGCLFLIIDKLNEEPREFFNQFIKGEFSDQLRESLSGDVFNMVNITLPPKFGNDVR
jgi:hypothetical protein